MKVKIEIKDIAEKNDLFFVGYQIETDKGWDWVIEFPKYKGCSGTGKTMEEALFSAKENLIFHLGFMIDDLKEKFEEE